MHAARRSLRALPRGPWRTCRAFTAAARMAAVKPFVLADIGEGIKEVQIIQWFVQPGARVEQFDKICEVQSDKASVDITSRFDGVITKLHYEPDAMAQVGKPLLDIDITGDVSEEDKKLLQPVEEEGSQSNKLSEAAKSSSSLEHQTASDRKQPAQSAQPSTQRQSSPASRAHSANLATPAVRGLLKELGVSIADLQGTGRDGRVLKEDVHNHVAARDADTRSQTASTSVSTSQTPSRSYQAPPEAAPQTETAQPLTAIQSAMYKSMTASLSIPHFVCADEVDLTALETLRSSINSSLAKEDKLSSLAFIVKAVSMTLSEYPILNARPDTASSSSLIHRSQHNISIAIDSPAGLVVPVIHSVQSLSIAQIAAELKRLSDLAQRNKLTRADLSGGTITVSNVGSIGGMYTAPRIVEGQVAILAIGRARDVPRFVGEEIQKRRIGVFSWAADHRVVEGAVMARIGERVRGMLEGPGGMVVGMR